MLPPRPLLALCLVLLGGLAWSVAGLDPPRVAVADAARWEGQAVRLEGWALAIQAPAPQGTRLDLVDGGARVAVRLPEGAGAQVALGDRLVVAGRLLRSAGSLVLYAEGDGAVQRVDGPVVQRPSWSALAAEPAAWQGRLVELRGDVRAGWLEGDGARVLAGEGAWPRSGAVQARGLLRYEPACLCHAFDAAEVRPWTP